MNAEEQEIVNVSKFNLSLPTLDRRRVLLLIGLGGLTIALLISLGGGFATVAALSDANWGLVALAVLIHYSGFAMRGHRWQLLLGTMGHRLSYWYVTTLLISGWFISALIPARAGDAVRVYLLRSPLQEGDDHVAVPVPNSFGSIVLERVLDILAILLLGAGFGYFVLRQALPTWVLTTYAIAVVLLLGFIVVLLFSPSLVGWLRGLLKHPLWQKILDFGADMADSLRCLPTRPLAMFLVIGESLYIWLCDALLLWLVLLSLSGELTAFSPAAFVALTVDIVAAIPLTPGGIGQIEAAYAALLGLFGMPVVVVTSVTLLTRVVSYWSFLIFSGVVTFAAGIGQLFVNGKGRRAKAGVANSLELPR